MHSLCLLQRSVSPAAWYTLYAALSFLSVLQRALDPSLNGLPLAVVQYNPLQGDCQPGEQGIKAPEPWELLLTAE